MSNVVPHERVLQPGRARAFGVKVALHLDVNITKRAHPVWGADDSEAVTKWYIFGPGIPSLAKLKRIIRDRPLRIEQKLTTVGLLSSSTTVPLR